MHLGNDNHELWRRRARQVLAVAFIGLVIFVGAQLANDWESVARMVGLLFLGVLLALVTTRR